MSTMPEYPGRPAAAQPPGIWSDEPVPDVEEEPSDVPPETAEGSRASARLLAGLIGLVLTPIAIGSMTYGGYRYQEITAAGGDFDHDLRGLAALLAGALVLLIVVWTGSLSAVGPLLGGVLWGLLPAALYLAYPEDTLSRIDDLPVVPADTEAGTVTWIAMGGFLAVGVTLVASGFSAKLRRR